MNPAQRLIAQLGGQCALARLLGRGQSMVQHWAKQGYISTWHAQLVALARERGISLTLGDLEKSWRDAHGGDRGPTGYLAMHATSTVGRALALLREHGVPLTVNAMVKEIHERFNQPVHKVTLVGNLSAYVRAKRIFYRSARGRYGLLGEKLSHKWRPQSDSLPPR